MTLSSVLGLTFFALAISFPRVEGSVAINWASDINASNEDSESQAITGDFIFELGSFGSGFVESDQSTWAAAWKALDRVRYQESDSAFGKTTVFSQNTSDFAVGQRAYIWGFRPSGPVSEWILISDPAWTWPNATSPLSFPRNWLVAFATESLVGTINSSGNQMMTEAIAEATPLIPWASWLSMSFDQSELLDAAVSGPLADPDDDGLSNQLEYFVGGDPKKNDASLFDMVVTVAGGQEEIECRFSPSAEVSPELYRNEDLSNWPGATTLGVPESRSAFTLTWTRQQGMNLRNFYQLRLAEAE